MRQRLQDGVRRCPGRPPRPRPRSPRLRGAQELLRLRQARVLLGVAWPGLTWCGGTAVGPSDSRRHIPFQETICTRGRRQAIPETFSRPKMSGERPCRINSLCGRCIEVFFFCRCQQPRVRPSRSIRLNFILSRPHARTRRSRLPSLEGHQETVGGCRLRSTRNGYILPRTERRRSAPVPIGEGEKRQSSEAQTLPWVCPLWIREPGVSGLSLLGWPGAK